MPSDPRQVLRQVFGYQEFRPPQEAIIRTLLAGGNALVLMPTGGGKSLCYQVPALVLPGTALIVSPLIALMEDQVQALRQWGVAAGALHSALDRSAQEQTEVDWQSGRLKLLYCAPERLLQERTLRMLQQRPVSLFAIDEAHCVSQWGHDFRPEYLGLSALHQRFPQIPLIALTATADPRTREEIIQRLGLEDAQVFTRSFDRPNIRYHLQQGGNGRERLLDFLRRHHPRSSGIVYCLSRKKVEDVAQWLQEQGFSALPYHAGMEAAQRNAHQQAFQRDEVQIMVATIAFGMGIDKPDIRFVAHLNLPKSLESYYQETGRAGRDGNFAEAWLHYSLQDVVQLRQMIQQSNADEAHKAVDDERLQGMLDLCESIDCRRQRLLAWFGEVLAEPCGNCDNCLHPPPTWEASEAARMALSSVYRSGQRYGVQYLTEILMGRDGPRIRELGHDRLTVYGIGRGITARRWQGVFRFLLARGYLRPHPEGHGGMILHESSRAVLQGRVSVVLRAEGKDEIGPRHLDRQELLAHDPLWQALRRERWQLAQEQGVPAYIILHDATLREIHDRRPRSLAALGEIPGLGARKLERFGARLLAVLDEYTQAVSA